MLDKMEGLGNAMLWVKKQAAKANQPPPAGGPLSPSGGAAAGCSIANCDAIAGGAAAAGAATAGGAGGNASSSAAGAAEPCACGAPAALAALPDEILFQRIIPAVLDPVQMRQLRSLATFLNVVWGDDLPGVPRASKREDVQESC